MEYTSILHIMNEGQKYSQYLLFTLVASILFGSGVRKNLNWNGADGSTGAEVIQNADVNMNWKKTKRHN